MLGRLGPPTLLPHACCTSAPVPCLRRTVRQGSASCCHGEICPLDLIPLQCMHGNGDGGGGGGDDDDDTRCPHPRLRPTFQLTDARFAFRVPRSPFDMTPWAKPVAVRRFPLRRWHVRSAVFGRARGEGLGPTQERAGFDNHRRSKEMRLSIHPAPIHQAIHPSTRPHADATRPVLLAMRPPCGGLGL